MTQAQLAYLASLPVMTINKIENGDMSANNMKLNTLRRIAHALSCRIFINIKSRPSPGTAECQLSGPELPPLPKLKRKRTVQGRKLAVLNGSSPWKKAHRKKRPSPQTETSGTEDKTVEPSEQKAE